MLAPGPILTALILALAPAANADTDLHAAGARAFKKCAKCHQIGEGARDRIGPHLNGVFGRRAALHEGFRYSKSMNRAGMDGLIWNQRTLDAYVANPKALVSGTRMNFGGMPDPEERTALLAYIRDFSDRPSDIPEAEPTAQGTDHDLDPAILAIQGDPEYGEYLSGECVTCHQSSGEDKGIPSITGWPDEDFVIAMHAYKTSLRPHPVMQMIAGRLSDDEIAALAAYFKDLEQ